MKRRAEWRALPRDPKSPLGWWWRDFLNVKIRSSLTSAMILGVSIGYTSYFIGWPILLLFVTIAVATVRLIHQRRADAKELEAIGPSPEPVNSIRVVCRFYDKDTCIGVDQGLLSFVNGWCYFDGIRTTFALRRSDVLPVASEDAWVRKYFLEGWERLTISTHDFEGKQVLASRLDEWERETELPNLGEPTLPPTTIHRSAYTELYTRLALGTLTLFGCAFLLSLPSYLFYVGSLSTALFAFAAIVSVWNIGAAYHAVRSFNRRSSLPTRDGLD